MESSGFNTEITRMTDAEEKPASTYLFGPVIYAPPSHPDTVLTSMCYMLKSMRNLGMSPDMQLFKVASQIKWNNMEQFKDVILRPGAMYIIMSACGAFGKLNGGSDVEVLISASFVCGFHQDNEWQELGMSNEGFPNDLRGYAFIFLFHWCENSGGASRVSEEFNISPDW